MTEYFENNNNDEEPKSIIGADSEDSLEKTMEEPKVSPKFSKSFLEFMENTFDIRKSIHYEDSIEKLKGIQEVISYMRYLYDNNYRLN